MNKKKNVMDFTSCQHIKKSLYVSYKLIRTIESTNQGVNLGALSNANNS